MKAGLFKYHALDIPFYKGSLHVCIGHNLTHLHEAAGFPVSPIKGRQPDDWGAIAFEADCGDQRGVFLMFRPNASAGIVAHEAVHAVNYIMLRAGITPDLHNDEPQAYLTEWVVSQVHYALTSKEVKPTKTISLR